MWEKIENNFTKISCLCSIWIHSPSLQVNSPSRQPVSLRNVVYGWPGKRKRKNSRKRNNNIFPLWQLPLSPVTVHSHFPRAKLSFGAFVKAVTFHTTSLKVHFIRSVLGLSGFSPSNSILEESPPLNQTFLRLSGRWTGVNRVPMVGFFVLIVEKGQRPLRRSRGGGWSFLQGQPLQAEEQVLSHQDLLNWIMWPCLGHQVYKPRQSLLSPYSLSCGFFQGFSKSSSFSPE